MKSKYVIVALFCVWVNILSAQQMEWWPLAICDTVATADTIHYQAYASAIASSGQYSPFMLRANQHGNISNNPYNCNLSLGIIKSATNPARWWDYDFAVQLTGRTHIGYFEQLYAHTRLYVVDITVGIHPIKCGSQSNALSMGGLLFSGNAHPIPRISVGIDDYIAFPGLFGYFEIKGGVTYGWLDDTNAYVDNVKLHHKFVGFRVGGHWPVTLAYEMHHAAQWGGYKYGGNTKVDYGNSFSDFCNVFFFRSGGISTSDQLNAQGNHIGFQELALTYQQRCWQVRAYWQSIFEDMSAAFIGFGMNAADGLWGINVRQKQWPFISELTYEFLNTTSQSGPVHDKDGLVFAGRDSYYTNSAYLQGWTYYGNIIGNPYIQTNNSRVRAHFLGLSGDIYGYKYRVTASYVDNYGVYQNLLPNQPSYVYTNNTAFMIEISRQFEKLCGLEFTLALAGDIGTQYNNSLGGYLRITKKGVLIKG